MSDVIVTDNDDAEGAADVAQIAAVAESATQRAHAENAAQNAQEAEAEVNAAASTAIAGAFTAVEAAQETATARDEVVQTGGMVNDAVTELRAIAMSLTDAVQLLAANKPQPEPVSETSPTPVQDTPPQKPHFLQRRVGKRKS